MSELISIIIPTYNRETTLPDTIDSVLAQTYKYWECIIVDDGSVDGTEELVKKYIEKDERFLFIKRPASRKKGASACRNLGFSISRGHYIQYLDSDDLLSPEKLEVQLIQLKNHSFQYVSCCSWTLFKSANNKREDLYEAKMPYKNDIPYSPCLFLELLGSNRIFLPPHCYLTPRELIEKAGPWNEEITNNDDAEFFTRLLLNAHSIVYTEKVATFYRSSGTSNLSSFSDKQKIKSLIKSWELIEEHLKKACSYHSLSYVQNAKQEIFSTLKNRFPRTVARNKEFFKVQFDEEPLRLKFFFIFKQRLMNNVRIIKWRILN